jgi:hypothetical protein
MMLVNSADVVVDVAEDSVLDVAEDSVLDVVVDSALDVVLTALDASIALDATIALAIVLEEFKKELPLHNPLQGPFL